MSFVLNIKALVFRAWGWFDFYTQINEFYYFTLRNIFLSYSNHITYSWDVQWAHFVALIGTAERQ